MNWYFSIYQYYTIKNPWIFIFFFKDTELFVIYIITSSLMHILLIWKGIVFTFSKKNKNIFIIINDINCLFIILKNILINNIQNIDFFNFLNYKKIYLLLYI